MTEREARIITDEGKGELKSFMLHVEQTLVANHRVVVRARDVAEAEMIAECASDVNPEGFQEYIEEMERNGMEVDDIFTGHIETDSMRCTDITEIKNAQ